MNNCINFKTRHKQYKLYYYCTKLKKEIQYSNCANCKYKEYKQIKPIKKRTNKLNAAEKKRFSIIYNDLTECANCGSKMGIELNEVYEGSYRQTSIKLGAVVPFCHDCHNMFHNNTLFNLYYKAMFQKAFMKIMSLDKFISTFGQNYIYKYNKRTKNF